MYEILNILRMNFTIVEYEYESNSLELKAQIEK